MICKNLYARFDKSVVSCLGKFMTKPVIGKECPKENNKYEVEPKCWNCD